MDDLDKRIIDLMQDELPICSSPFAQVAAQLEIAESELLTRLQRLLDNGILTRFGPLFDAEKMGGALTLAAIKVPPERFDQVASLINAFPEVAHNYARTHEFNMWFVLATETKAQIDEVIEKIESLTGLRVYNLPKIKEYYVGLRLSA